MNYYKYLSLFVIILFCSCNPLEKTVIPIPVMEADSDINLNDIRLNEKIRIGEIQKRTIQSFIPCTGKLDIPPTSIHSVHSLVQGQVRYLKFLPGDFVKKGALLATIQNPDLINQQRLLLETKSELDLAQKDFNRKEILFNENATPQKVYERSKSTLNLLKTRYNGLQKELELIGIDIEDLKLNSNYQSSVRLYARHSGYVHKVLITKGQMISPEDQLLEIADTDHMHLELQILSKDIAMLKKGQKVIFTIPGSSQSYNATIAKINPMIHSDQSTLQVHCHIEELITDTMVAGLFVNARLQLDPVEQEVLPRSGIIKEGENYFAFRIQDEEMVKTRLSDVKISNNYASFSNSKEGEWVLEGAYYVE